MSWAWPGGTASTSASEQDGPPSPATPAGVKDAWEAFKRGSVDQTPPVDPTRRRFLTVAAVGSFVGAGSLALAAAAPNVPAAVTVRRHSRPDPVFGMIEAHRRASAAHGIALVEQARLEQTGDLDAAWSIAEQPCHDDFGAFDALLSAEATTVPGIVAQLAYLQEIAERNAWMFNDREDSAPRLLKGFAASIGNVLAVLS
jgi:hypothetical protein